MFTEHKEAGEVAPVKELDEPANLLLKAADLIEKHGHCRMQRINDRGQFCVMGAISMARFGDMKTANDGAVVAAGDRLAKALGGSYDACTAVLWNNAEHRTQAEVVAKLRAVALSA